MVPRRLTLRLVVLGLVVVSLAQQPAFDDEDMSGDDGSSYGDEEDMEEEESLFDSSPHWREMAGRLQRSVDADGLLRARRWGNVANGALLAATGPVALTVSLFGLKLSNAVLSLYVAAFGGVLAGIELGAAPIAPWVSSNLSYLMTGPGRTALLAFLGGLTFPLGKLGVVPAILTCLNAFFNSNFNALLDFVSEDDGPHPDAASPEVAVEAAAEPATEVDGAGAAYGASEAAQEAEQLAFAAQAMQEARAAQARAQAEAEAAAEINAANAADAAAPEAAAAAAAAKPTMAQAQAAAAEGSGMEEDPEEANNVQRMQEELNRARAAAEAQGAE